MVQKMLKEKRNCGNHERHSSHSRIYFETERIQQHTIMVRDSYVGSYPVWAPVEPKAPKHAPTHDAMSSQHLRKNQICYTRN